MKTFVLEREEDVSGVSGTGVVAEGVEFSDGSVCLKWLGRFDSTVIWKSIHHVETIHGHDGKTKVVWSGDDSDGNPDRNIHGYGTDANGHHFDVVRYNRASKYFLEYKDGTPRRQVSLHEAVTRAEGAYIGRPGGTAFDREWCGKAGL